MAIIDQEVFDTLHHYEVYEPELAFVLQALYDEYVGNVEYQNSRLEPEDDFGRKPIKSFCQWIHDIQDEAMTRYTIQ